MVYSGCILPCISTASEPSLPLWHPLCGCFVERRTSIELLQQRAYVHRRPTRHTHGNGNTPTHQGSSPEAALLPPHFPNSHLLGRNIVRGVLKRCFGGGGNLLYLPPPDTRHTSTDTRARLYGVYTTLGSGQKLETSAHQTARHLVHA